MEEIDRQNGAFLELRLFASGQLEVQDVAGELFKAGEVRRSSESFISPELTGRPETPPRQKAIQSVILAQKVPAIQGDDGAKTEKNRQGEHRAGHDQEEPKNQPGTLLEMVEISTHRGDQRSADADGEAEDHLGPALVLKIDLAQMITTLPHKLEIILGRRGHDSVSMSWREGLADLGTRGGSGNSFSLPSTPTRGFPSSS